MAIGNSFREQITPREYDTWQHEKEMTEKAYEFQLRIKELDIEAAKLEAKVTSWFKLPLTLLKLPLYLLLVIPLSIYAARKQDVPPDLWKLLGK